MARRRGRSYRNNPYNAKAYKFTARRRAALKKAQAKSARERRIKVGIMAAGGIAAVGTALYLGRNTSVGKGVRRDVAKQVRRFSPQHVGRAANLKRARLAVNPLRKEAVRTALAISPAGTPHQPGHVGQAGPIHIGPHTPGNVVVQGKPDPSTFNRTQVPQADDRQIQAAFEAEEAFKKSGMQSLARFTDTTEATLPQELTGEKIQPLRRATAARAVAQHQNARGRSGSPTATQGERRDTVDMMIAGSIDAARAAHGVSTPIRTNPRAVPGHIGAGGSLAEHDQIWAEYDAHRGLSTTRPGTVPHVTAHSNKTATPGVQVKGPIFVAGQSVPGWHKLSKEGKKAMRGIGEPHGFKINAAGKITQPKPKMPKANPSGLTPGQQAHKTRRENTNASRAAKGMYSMPTSNPSHGQEVPHWDLLTPEQQHRAQEGFRRYSAARGWRTMLGASGSYMDFDR